MAPVLDGFHPAVRAWFDRRFGAPSRAQERGWPAIREADAPPGYDVLLCAPTGSGKTLAAFLWAIDRLVTEGAHAPLPDQVFVLYVSPLKALANDIRLNLEEPLAGIVSVAAELKGGLSPVRAGLRTGDTPVGERGAMLRRPPHILVTTPESLFILLTSPRFRQKLTAVRHVIVDELHALAGNKRGAHLALTLERLERMVRKCGGPRPVRIGLSATLNPIETLGAFLAGARVAADGSVTPRPVRIVRADDGVRPMDLAVVAPGPELGPLATHEHWEALYDDLARLIDAHRTTLVFTLSRRLAERIALNLQKRVGESLVMAHHGSLARAERLSAEQRLKRGELKAIVATSSLELGIDVGAVDLVCQVDSPRTISAAIQRVGRSGHRLGATPRGRLFALTLDDLVECAAAVRAIRRGLLDEVEIPRGCLDVAAQQIVAVAAEEDEIAEGELLALLRSAYNFAELDAAALARLLAQMAAALPEQIRGGGPRIIYDQIGRRVRARRGARLSAITSGGTIPESGNLDVVIKSEDRRIGDVEEDFAQESSRGDIFALGSMPWRILGISRNRLLVEPAPGMAPTLPFWQTEAAGRSPALSAALCELRREIAARLSTDADGVVKWLAGECAMDERAAALAVDYVRRGFAALGAVPDERTLVVERFFDGLGGTQVVIHSPLGMRVNRALGLALRKRLCRTFDFEIQASAIDDAVLLALNSRHSFPLADVLGMLDAPSARDVLVQAILDAPMFEVRFRHVATRALFVARAHKGRKVPAWIQRLRALELMTAVFPQRNACFENRPPAIDVPDHFLVAETLAECLTESTDLPRMLALLRGREAGAVSVLTVDAISPSVFAHRVLLAWDYSFLDDGERANRRSRTVAMNRAMAADVLQSEDLSAMLSAEAIAEVAAEAACLAPARRARNRDELLEVIRAHGTLSPDALEGRTSADPSAMVAELENEGRLLRARLAPQGPEMLVAAEDRALVAAAYPGASFTGRGRQLALTLDSQAPPAAAPDTASAFSDPEAARTEIVRRALATSGPVTADELAARLRMAPTSLAATLAALEARGDVFRGRFTPRPQDGGGEEWCERYNLEKIHRVTLARLRSEVEPAADEEFAAFRLKWDHIGGADLEPGVAGLSAVLEKLSGFEATPDFWEEALLPARVPGYRPDFLDALILGGEFAWAAGASGPTGAGSPGFLSRLTFARRRERALLAATGAPTDPAEDAVYHALLEGGAQYLDEVSERASLSERDALGALWRLAAAAMVTNDSFAPVRALFALAKPLISGADSFERLEAAARARLKSGAAGRWSALGARGAQGADLDPARQWAALLLRRNGVLAREMLAAEGAGAPSWGELLFALRRMEYAGTIRRGWFVRALSAEQYALPEAAAMLRAMRPLHPARAPSLALSAADPANPYGWLLPGCGVARDAGNLLVIRAGRPVLALAARTLALFAELDEDAFAQAVLALLAMRRKVVIETIGDAPALGSPRVAAMAALGFHSDGRALVRDGLPGPIPGALPRTFPPPPEGRVVRLAAPRVRSFRFPRRPR